MNGQHRKRDRNHSVEARKVSASSVEEGVFAVWVDSDVQLLCKVPCGGAFQVVGSLVNIVQSLSQCVRTGPFSAEGGRENKDT